MNLASAIRAMVQAGASPEMILAVVEADESEREAVAQQKRSKDAERQRRHRMSRDVTVTGCDTPSPKDTGSKTSTTENNQNPFPTPPIVPRSPFGFEAFWSSYPNKVGRRKAEEAYDRATRRSEPDLILAGLQRAIEREWRESLGNPPHPTTWLNQDRWSDEPAEMHRQQNYSPGQIQAATSEAGFRMAMEWARDKDEQQARDNSGNQGVVVALPQTRHVGAG